MYHSTSGKRGFLPYIVDTMLQIEPSQMKKIFEREEELRMGTEYHDKISEKDDVKWIRDVTVALQEQVLAEFGYGKEYLVVLRNARYQYRNDPEMNQITVYQRCDRSKDGDIEHGGYYPNITNLFRLDGSNVSLDLFIFEQANPAEHVLILAGSIT